MKRCFKDLLRGLFLQEARYELQVFVTKYQKLSKPKEITIDTKPKRVFRINKEKSGFKNYRAKRKVYA